MIKQIIHKLKKINQYLIFIEREKIKAMIYCGQGWG